MYSESCRISSGFGSPVKRGSLTAQPVAVTGYIAAGEPAGEVVARAREAGLLVLTAGDHTVRILPPLIASHDDLARGLAILEQVL